MTYTIIGGDKKEYGPISSEDIRQWISEGRLNGQTLAKSVADSGWRTLASYPEFADVLGAGAPPPTIGALPSTPPAFPPHAAGTVDLERDYELDIGGCITRGWTLVTGNMGQRLGPRNYGSETRARRHTTVTSGGRTTGSSPGSTPVSVAR